MAAFKHADAHNMVAFLEVTKKAPEFEPIVTFLRRSNIRFALLVDPEIHDSHQRSFWTTAQIETLEGESQIKARVNDTEVIITESAIRKHLKLHDESGTISIPDKTLFDTLKLMGYEGEFNKFTFYKGLVSPQWRFFIHVLQHCISKKKSTWNEFNTTIATALVCMSTGIKFNFSKMILNDLIWNLTHSENQFLMYPRFLEIILNKELGVLPNTGIVSKADSLSSKVFSNMKRPGNKFSQKETPLFSTMVVVPPPIGEGTSSEVGPHPTPTKVSIPAASQAEGSYSPSHNPAGAATSVLQHYARKSKRFPSPLGLSKQTKKPSKNISESPVFTGKRDTPEPSSQLKKRVVHKEGGDHVERAHTTASMKGIKTQSTATPRDGGSSEPPSGGPWCQETMGGGDVLARPNAPLSSSDPPPVGTQQGGSRDSFDYSNIELMEMYQSCTLAIQDQAKQIVILNTTVSKMAEQIQVLQDMVKQVLIV